VIQVEHVTKRYGEKVAVDDLTFTVKPGVVTGFLGPNGAGKSTTMRVIVGLDAPNAGTALVGGRHYRDLPAPLFEVGALLEARAVHTGRSAYNHLLALARTHGIGRGRVREVLNFVGLSDVAHKRTSGFSLGMGQRLGVAGALLGDPDTLILDEPANGLDPEGIVWIRTLLKTLAAEGRTVFVSSHLMAEIAQTAERIVIITRGRLVADTTIEDLLARASHEAAVSVRSPQAAALRRELVGDGVVVRSPEPDRLEVEGLTSSQVGEIAFHHGIVLHELIPQQASLEEAFMRLTGGELEFQSGFLETARSQDHARTAA
jgi:ABC-2 type transport system ATP-binding protein